MNCRPVIAMIYDFDNTLIDGNMQECGLIEDLGYTTEEFWKIANTRALDKGMDRNLEVMKFVKEEVEKQGKKLTREFLRSYGPKVDKMLMPGVTSWFENINKLGEHMGLEIEHYVISSGFEEIIEGTSIYGRFKEVFGCEYDYNADGEADWVLDVINFTGKTQYISRINKGLMNLADNTIVNRKVKGDRRVPYHNMIYFGDGFTDIPCMQIVKNKGGRSIGVYGHCDNVAKQLLQDERVDFIAPADYSANSELFGIVSEILESMNVQDNLERIAKKQRQCNCSE
ncbi:MAG: haloacid dehalogenase-like hydrolase [archaeon]|nr:haloacid dehalogenase-like hydrolase [archaeon]